MSFENQRRIRLGKHEFYWSVQRKYPLDHFEVTIRLVAASHKKLTVDIEEAQAFLRRSAHRNITPKDISHFIELALRYGWLNKEATCSLREFKGIIWKGNLSIQQEKDFILQVAYRYKKERKVIDWSKQLNQLVEFEKVVGLRFPTFFKQLYMYGADGLGPDAGLLPIVGNEQAVGLIELNKKFRLQKFKEPFWQFPTNAIVFLDWGQGIYSGVQCGIQDEIVFVWDENQFILNGTWKSGFWQHTRDLVEWFDLWQTTDREGVAMFKDMYRVRNLV